MTIIEVRGGIVQEVYSDSEEEVIVMDYDKLDVGEKPNYKLGTSTITEAEQELRISLTKKQHCEIFG